MEKDIRVNISDDDMDLMDTIYVPSKYPVYSALPHALPDPEICDEAMKIAEKVRESVYGILKVDKETGGRRYKG